VWGQGPPPEAWSGGYRDAVMGQPWGGDSRGDRGSDRREKEKDSGRRERERERGSRDERGGGGSDRTTVRSPPCDAPPCTESDRLRVMPHPAQRAIASV
jgi:hypothetical protein